MNSNNLYNFPYSVIFIHKIITTYRIVEHHIDTLKVTLCSDVAFNPVQMYDKGITSSVQVL